MATSRTTSGGIVIVGAGLAGLFTALKLSPLPVTVLSPVPLGEGASSTWAQGGIAAAVGEGDTTEAHAIDTMAAGAGIVDEEIARMVAGEAPERIRDLLRYGVPFDRDLEGHFVLSREAAHSAKRVVRVSGDRAGAAIMQALIATVRQTPSIRVLEGWQAWEITPAGEYTLPPPDGGPSSLGAHLRVRIHNGRERHRTTALDATAVVLATGGIGQLYAVTTNPANSCGQGVAMAARAGAVIADAEFVQFHPTAIDVGADPAPLASEALRGEGAVLVNAAGHRFMRDAHPDAELGPRDVVARAVFREIQAGRGAFLNCRTAIGKHFPTAFPTIYAHCRKAGIDPATDLIPVAPAEHFHMGGVATDRHGRSSVPGLWAVGEVASTGLHGANRLASNSLLEAVVFGARVAADLAREVKRVRAVDMTEVESTARDSTASTTPADVAAAVAAVRRTMTDLVGVERSAASLSRAVRALDDIARTAPSDPGLSAMLVTAEVITAAALARHESRGGHYRTDFPEPRPALAQRSRLTLPDVETIKRATLTRPIAEEPSS
ncbi:MAG: L-aspartate oxidase [Hyphomicrobiaceae bacterium]|nr:L-aspartate oxidase [Hyphomicrobiaceae bacterium]